MSNLPVLTATLDNAQGTLSATIASNATSITLQAGQGANFPQPENGTATSTGTGSTLNCTGIGSLVSVGQPIRNVTDGSWAFILTVSTNSVTTTALQGGSDNKWESADVWCVNEMVITLQSATNSNNTEKVRIVGRSGDILQCSSSSDRGFDSSTAQQFVAGDYVYLEVISYTIRKIIEQFSELARLIDQNIISINDILNGSSLFVTSTGSSNAYAASYPNVPSLVAGTRLTFIANFMNTGACTFTPTLAGVAQSAASIKKEQAGSLVNLSSSDIQSNQIVTLEYDGTQWQVASPLSTSFTNYRYGTGADGPLNVTSGTTTLDAGGGSVLIKNYTSINISSGATLTVTNQAAAGVLLILLSQGNVTIAGTIDLSGKGSAGGASITKTVTTSNNQQASNGNNGAAPYNNLGLTRNGQGGQYSGTTLFGGGSGGGNFDVSTSTNSANSVPVASGTMAMTIDLAAMGGPAGILAAPGGGGGGGSVSVWTSNNTTTGTFTATSPAGGNGGGGLYIACGGNWNFTGVINLSGQNATSGSLSVGTNTQYAVGYGGGGGGAGGIGKADVAGSIVNTGGITAAGGTHTVGNSQSVSATCFTSIGTDGAAGSFTVVQSY